MTSMGRSRDRIRTVNDQHGYPAFCFFSAPAANRIKRSIAAKLLRREDVHRMITELMG